MTDLGSTPLYQQIYADIKDSIESGVYKTGDRIPSEAELSKEYDVSRITVRRAIEGLCSDGFLNKKQGRGTFVGKSRLYRRLSQSREVRSFSSMCKDGGVMQGAHLIDRQIVPARPQEIEFFGIEEGALLLYIHRIRTADEVPVLDENIFLPYDWAATLFSMPLENKSIFDTLYEVTGRRPVSSTIWRISAVRATVEQSSRLDIPVGDPLIYTINHYVDSGGNPACIGRDYFVGSRYELSL
ncbi:GntR family transcriptional regulator [Thermophilibacter immobilis]|uniref:GntR family transcriptional regulator n=1 Tax=Thermophilibacter immobilis TaxID=2779519 RepID=A0A7S7M8S8_9ACTN|nr:GntR family transcriptional regulator [Thermophilibacter immobilis]QOY60562.1 GntR family transcriptional regulator [Thermophilibacter immobilis]